MIESDNFLKAYQKHAAASLEIAQALPFNVYRDQKIYELERAKVFSSDWVFICTAAELPNSGDYFALTIAHEPIVVVHSNDGQLRALSNVCKHRGTILLDNGFGNIKQRFSCPYHAWTYSDSGELVGIPYSGKTKIDKSSHCLNQFKISIWHGLVFVCLDKNAESLSSRCMGMDKYIDLFDISRFNTAYPGSVETWQANWKIVLENAMESYHLFKVHKETLETITPTKEAFYIEGKNGWALTAGGIKSISGSFLQWLTSRVSEEYDYYLLISIPPSFVGILTYDSLDWINVLPTGAEECYVRSGSLSTAGGDPDKDKQFVETFFAEDRMICERIQQGMYAQHSQGGKLVEMERVVVDFHQYLNWRIFGGSVPGHYRSPEADMFENKGN